MNGYEIIQTGPSCRVIDRWHHRPGTCVFTGTRMACEAWIRERTLQWPEGW